jgi:hypothetical protein
LVCALVDSATKVEWGCNTTDLSVPNVAHNSGNLVDPGAEIGDGMSNTNHILTDCSTAPAALAARSLGPEWFLPSIKELNEIYVNIATLEAVLGVNNGFSDAYWSSTESDRTTAWRQKFSDGSQLNSNKANKPKVRAVRAF